MNNVWSLDEIRQNLVNRHLDLVTVMNTASLPQEWLADDIGDTTQRWPSLLLAAHRGPDLWQSIFVHLNDSPHPFDHWSTESVRLLVESAPVAVEHQILYPGSGTLPLQKLGEWAGWASSSQLGLGIHPTFGTWFAFRVAALISVPVAGALEARADIAPSPCDECPGKPCIQACPVGAPARAGAFNLSACIDRRLMDGSTCATVCHARVACPAGLEYRYQDEQIAWHGQRSLDSLRRWRGC